MAVTKLSVSNVFSYGSFSTSCMLVNTDKLMNFVNEFNKFLSIKFKICFQPSTRLILNPYYGYDMLV